MRRSSMLRATMLSCALLAASCSSDEDSSADDQLGSVVVAAGSAIQIRSLNTIAGPMAELGLPNHHAVELAVADYGPIQGFDVAIGPALDDACSADGGRAGAEAIIADDQVVGVIGTTCSVAAVEAAPLISDAGLVMLSGANTSPTLTSDFGGSGGEHHHAGYYRTSHNGLSQGAALADFVRARLGFTTAAIVHDGDPDSIGVSQSFADAFTAVDGVVTETTVIARGDTDLGPALVELGLGRPEVIVLSLYSPEAVAVARQIGGVSGLEDTVLLGVDTTVVDSFMAEPASQGAFLAGPDVLLGTNTSTGVSAPDVLTAYAAAFGGAPSGPFWAHSYDATVLLLDAIDAASLVDADGDLVIDRARVRAHLDAVTDHVGLIGAISCDRFGDCGTQRTTVVDHRDPGNISFSRRAVIYEYAPS